MRSSQDLRSSLKGIFSLKRFCKSFLEFDAFEKGIRQERPEKRLFSRILK